MSSPFAGSFEETVGESESEKREREERAGKKPNGPDAQPPDRGAPPIGEERPRQDGPLPKLTPIRFVKGEEIPQREWTVPEWIPKRKVTLIQGDGGDGKTSLMQQLQSSCATGLPWLELLVEECCSIGAYTEDEERDLKIRQAAIDAHYGRDCASTGKMHLFPRTDQENELVVFPRAGKPELTPFYRQLVEAALDYRAGLVTLDVAVDLFGGDEIKRREVRAFMASLNTLARKIDGSVVLSSHVSQAAIRSDGGHSASTDWSNVARSRAYLSRPKDEEGSQPDPDARILTRKKAQYARAGETIYLRWSANVIIPDTIKPGASPFGVIDAETTFLDLMRRFEALGQPLSGSLNAVNYAPRVFAKLPRDERRAWKLADFEKAMNALFLRSAIRLVEYRTPSRHFSHKIVIAEPS
jgi:RecA-family ATPase